MECRERRRHSPKRPRYRDRSALYDHERVKRRPEGQGAAGKGSLRQPGHPASRRAHQPPGSGRHRLAGGVPDQFREHRHRGVPRPLFPEQGLHPHRRHRLRQDPALRRKLRFLVRVQPASDQADEGSQQEEGGKDQGAPGVHLPLLRQRLQVQAGHFQKARPGKNPAG